MMEYANSYDSPIRLRIGHRWYLFTKDVKSIEYILGSTMIIDKSYDYHFFHSWLGDGLLTSTGKL